MLIELVWLELFSYFLWYALYIQLLLIPVLHWTKSFYFDG